MLGTKTRHSVTIGLVTDDTVSRQNLTSESEVSAVLYVHALDCWPQGVEVPADPYEAVNTYFGVYAPGEWVEITESTSLLGGIVTWSRKVLWEHPSAACMS